MYILLTLFYSFWAFNAKNGLQVGRSNGSDGEINLGSMYLNYILLFGSVLGKDDTNKVQKNVGMHNSVTIKISQMMIQTKCIKM